MEKIQLQDLSKEQLIEFINTLSLELQNANLKILKYEEQLRNYKKQTYVTKSEKIDTLQLSLFNETERESDLSIEEPVLVEKPKEKNDTNIKTVKKPRKEKRPREVLFEGLPVERIEYHLDDMTCKQCGGDLHVIRQETKKYIKIIPAQAIVVEEVCDICGCRHCEQHEITTPIIEAKAPKRAIPGSIASSSLISYIMEQKYVNSMPLYRQEQQFKRLGIELSRQNLANWMIKGSEWFEPIFKRMYEFLLKQDIVLADETTLQVLKEPGKSPTTKSYIWLYRTGKYGYPIVLYDYQPSREGKHPENFLKSYKGYLLVDGYQGYDNIPNVKLCGCWAHARRKFYEAIVTQPKSNKNKQTLTNAEQGFAYISQLYEIEDKIKDLSPEERYKIRLERSRPILDAFSVWLNEKSLVVIPKSKTGIAIAYCLNQWKKLNNFLLDGRLEIDNNRSERSIKSVVIGRKNFLFSNTPKGAKASAIIYSLVETAKGNNLNPQKYLEYLLDKLPNMDLSNQEEIDALLPWNIKLPE
jgi:transposase